jgi:hypothetical protein
MEKFRCMSNRDKLDVPYTIKNDDIWQLINPNLGIGVVIGGCRNYK